MVPLTQLLDLAKFLLRDTKEEIEEAVKDVKSVLSGYQSMCKILKSGLNDMSSALQTVKTAALLKAAEAKKAAKAKKRAAKLPAECSTSDPMSIKSYRVIEKQQSIPVVNSFEHLKKGWSRGDIPFVIRPANAQLSTVNLLNRFKFQFLGSYTEDITLLLPVPRYLNLTPPDVPLT